MGNTKHDTASFESCSNKREMTDISDANLLYDSFLKDKKNGYWKEADHRYGLNILSEIAITQRELRDRTYKFSDGNVFVLNERGKTRVITGDRVRDRVVKNALTDGELLPYIRKRLIHDNGASLKGKGISFTRQRLETHLKRYYRENGGNDGHILLVDYSKYFDNIRHKEFIDMFDGISELGKRLLEEAVSKSRVDVSHLTDDEYAECMDVVFNSLEYEKIDPELFTGEKFLHKHLNIGCVVAQVAGVAYPTPLDNYIKVVLGEKYYGRYMDDSYIIHASKEHLELVLEQIIIEAGKIGIFVNRRKTKIVKLSSLWRFLQVQYSLTESGRIIKKIHPKKLADMRHKLKKLAGVLTEKGFDNFFKAWFRNHYKLMSKKQRKNIEQLFMELKLLHYEQGVTT